MTLQGTFSSSRVGYRPKLFRLTWIEVRFDANFLLVSFRVSAILQTEILVSGRVTYRRKLLCLDQIGFRFDEIFFRFESVRVSG